MHFFEHCNSGAVDPIMMFKVFFQLLTSVISLGLYYTEEIRMRLSRKF